MALASLDERLWLAEDAARRRGVALRAPVLALGVAERVGSNWLTDLWRASLVVHNEPLRQQVSAGFPLSPLNPHVIDVTGQDGAAEMAGLSGLARHWLATFVVGKYATGRQHLVKETNLFFATGGVLRLFPGAALLVLTRSPIGIVSSFLRGGLWDRWDYPSRYAALAATTTRPGLRRWAGLLPDDQPSALVGLSRLIVVNTLLLAEQLTDREYVAVGYERHVLDPARVHSQLRGLLPEHPVQASRSSPDGGGWTADGTYATTGKQELVAVLNRRQARTVTDETTRRLHDAGNVVTPEAVDLASSWLAGGDLYRLDPPHPGSRTVCWTTGADRPRRQALPTPRPGLPTPAGEEYVDLGGLAWRGLLVSNDEFAAWLNLMRDAGLANTHDGIHLLATEMPAERGGRLHRDPGDGRWRALPGFGEHPVYWVTWIAGAAYAVCQGARLPTRAELDAVTVGVVASNCDYRVGDVVPVREPDQGRGQVHHLVGNVQVWCADGPTLDTSLPAERYLHGAAWNTPSTSVDIARVRSRHLLGSSRGVGIRLVREPDRPVPALDPVQVCARLRQWLDTLTGQAPAADRDRALGDLDRAVIDALHGSLPPTPDP